MMISGIRKLSDYYYTALYASGVGNTRELKRMKALLPLKQSRRLCTAEENVWRGELQTDHGMEQNLGNLLSAIRFF
ncbi:hypothetical protein ACOSP7_001856 [Xanthoceras sorbifolium]